MVERITYQVAEHGKSQFMAYGLDKGFNVIGGFFYPSGISFNYFPLNIGPSFRYALKAGSFVASTNSPLDPSLEVEIAKVYEYIQPHHLARKPKAPYYNPPRFRRRKPPTLRVRAKSSDSDLKRYLLQKKNVEEFNKTKQLRLDAYNSAYAKRKAKYQQSLANWERSLRSLKARVRTGFARFSKHTQFNPYCKISFDNIGDLSPVRWKYTPPERPSIPEGVSWQALASLHNGLISLNPVSNPSLVEEECKQFQLSVRDAIWNHAEKEFSDKLINRIYKKVEDSKVDVLTFAAERKQTVSMFKSLVSDLLSLAKGKKRFFQNLKGSNLVTKVANKHLEASFGISPLLGDLETVITDLARDPLGFTFKVKSIQKKIPITFSDSLFTIDGFLTVRYVMDFSVKDSLFQKLQQWGLNNPVRTLYEVAPWSFLVDWLYPLGAYISSSTALTGVEFRQGSKSISFIGTVETKVPDQTSYLLDLPSRAFSVYEGRFAFKVKDRHVLTEMPNYRPLSLRNPFSWSHGALSLSLLVQKLKP